ncbi:hypothetical protein [Herbaspirillum sp. SJZ099]|uniref:hypothetical protein n=1 Tax=Herbaspirillum sp. SJZ099 TaxID=2572916 RepID=UPI00119F0CAD|nr:hypothetical protein [Herbaspirillum sp. SJZ099]
MDASDVLARTSARDMPDFSGCADEVADWIMAKMAAARRFGCALAMRRKRYGNSIGACPNQWEPIAFLWIWARPCAAFIQHFIFSSRKIHPGAPEFRILHELYARMRGCSFSRITHIKAADMRSRLAFPKSNGHRQEKEAIVRLFRGKAWADNDSGHCPSAPISTLWF